MGMQSFLDALFGLDEAGSTEEKTVRRDDDDFAESAPSIEGRFNGDDDEPSDDLGFDDFGSCDGGECDCGDGGC